MGRAAKSRAGSRIAPQTAFALRAARQAVPHFRCLTFAAVAQLSLGVKRAQHLEGHVHGPRHAARKVYFLGAESLVTDTRRRGVRLENPPELQSRTRADGRWARRGSAGRRPRPEPVLRAVSRPRDSHRRQSPAAADRRGNLRLQRERSTFDAGIQGRLGVGQRGDHREEHGE